MEFKDNSLKTQISNLLLVEKKSLLAGSLVYLIIFMLYLELNPRITNVWLRKDSNNIYRFSLKGLFLILKKPFEYVIFWKPSFWDLNYYVGAYIFSNVLDKFFFV